MINIGYLLNDYAERRLIIEKVNVSEKRGQYNQIKIPDTDRLAALYSVIGKDVYFKNRTNFYYHPGKRTDYDVIHGFNWVCNTGTPWVSSFESVLPRVIYDMGMCRRFCKDWIEHNLRLMQKENCLGLLALSEHNKKMQLDFLSQYGNTVQKSIGKKTIVLSPPQRVLISDEALNNKYLDLQKELRFIITGNSFFEKGGIEIFEALRTFRKDINIKLNVVSNFNGCRHLPVHTGFRPEEERNLKRSIADNKEWVTVYKNLPNRQVLKLMQQAHIGLLPSYVDTYGYSVLESQAAGCPVITTDIRALPEMNNQKYGWVCNINDDMRSMGGIKDRKCLNQLREKNRIALIQSVEEILNHPESIEEKGRRSVDRIKREHSPAAYGDKLYQIYCKGVNHG